MLGETPGPGWFAMAPAALLLDRAAREEDLRWHERLAEASGKPVVIGPCFDHFDDPGIGHDIIDLVASSRRDGVTVVPQVSVFTFELWQRLDNNPLIVRVLPTLRRALRDGGTDALRAVAADRGARSSARRGAAIAPFPVFSGRWDHVFVRKVADPTRFGSLVDRDLASIAANDGVEPVDVLLDTAIAEDFETQFSTLMRNTDDDEIGRMLAHPIARIGASDAGAHVLSNTDSAYAIWTLQHWWRERGVLGLERAVRMLTADQADLLGLPDRGRVAPGLAADLVLFDPDRIARTGVRYVDDQPAGGRRLISDVVGVEASIVNGVVATRDGRSTGADRADSCGPVESLRDVTRHRFDHRQRGQGRPASVAATVGDASITFAELDASSNRTARVLDAQGVRAGDRVTWWGETSLERFPVFGALARIGAVFAPVNARLGLEEARPIVELARPRLLLTDAAHDDAGREIAGRLGIEHVGPELADLAAHAPSTPLDVAGPDERDPHVIFFTSGSTGRPKGVVLSHRANWLRSYPGRDERAGREAASCACSRCSTWPAGRSRSARGRAAGHPLLARRSGRAARVGAAPPGRTALRDPRGVGADPRARRRALRPVDAARSRHRHVGDAARAHRRDPRRAPAHRHPHLLRIDRGRARDDPRRTTISRRSPAVSVARNRDARCG